MVYMDLKELAERLNVTVYEKNLRQVGTRIDSGSCIVKGKQLFIMDKHKSIREKIEILAAHLGRFPHDDIYMVPTLRKIMKNINPIKLPIKRSRRADEGRHFY